ncbi:MAG: hypothetical protein PWP07_2707 [Epulopiscium sp.]|nr:hypothetical protein [Candidatus Epulonipiscium sp.]
MWFATADGLASFDGYSFATFKIEKKSGEPYRKQIITSLANAADGNLWVGTSLGLYLFRRATGTFENVSDGNAHKYSLRSHEYICKVHLSKRNVLWIEAASGKLCRYDLVNRQWQYYPHSKPDQLYYYYHDIYEEDDSTLWIGGRSMQIMKFNVKKSSFTLLPTNSEDPSLKRPDVSCFFKDRRGTFYIGGIDGLFILDKTSHDFKKVFPNSTFSIAEDEEGYLWLGTGSGLIRFSPHDSKHVVYSYSPYNTSTLINNHIYKVFFDRKGCLWLGTRGGVSMLSDRQNRFFHIKHVNNNNHTPSSDKITALFTDSKGKVWIGHYADGFDILDFDLFVFKNFRHSETTSNSLAGNRVSAIYEDKQGIMWIGLWTGRGFNSFDPYKKTFRKYSFVPSSLKFDWYSSFIEDGLNRFYLGFWGSKGMTLFDRKTGSFGKSLYFDRQDRIPSRLVNVLYQDRYGQIWVGTTDNGFAIYNPFSDKVKSFPANDSTSQVISPLVMVNCFLQDDLGYMWIGGDELYTFSTVTKKFVNVNSKYNLNTGEVRSLVKDKQGKIWVATAKNGLYCIDPRAMSYNHYTDKDGLGTYGFNKASTILPNGWIILGSDNGLCLFNPNDFIKNELPPKAYFSKIKFMGKEQMIYPQGLSSVYVPSGVEYFSVSFASDDYHQPYSINYYYRIEELDNSWRMLSKNNQEAVFDRPPPGKYKLLLKAGVDGVPLGDDIASLTLLVESRYYQTWWFRFLLIMFFLGIIFWFIYSWVQNYKLSLKTTELRQTLLRLQMNPHFVFNSLFSIQNFIYKNNPDEAGRYLSAFAQLIRSILDNSRVEFITLDKEIKTLELYLTLQRQRFSNKFDYEICINKIPNIEEMRVPPMLAQPFIENAIEHGIRNVENGIIQIRFEKYASDIEILVIDNGHGIYQKKSSTNNTTYKHQSLAIKITQERVRLLNKKYRTSIKFDILDMQMVDANSKGTQVRFLIPLKLAYA